MLKVGVASVDITPPVGVDLCGFARRTGPSIDVADRLFSKSLYLGDDHHRVVLSTNDVVGLTPQTCDAVRDRLSANDQSHPPVHFMASHTHSGPATIPLHLCGKQDAKYMESLEEKLVASIGKAQQNPVRGRIGVGQIQVPLNVNRRNPGAGAVDPTLTVIALQDSEGNRAATICHYACHPVVLGHDNRQISADYAGYLQAEIERQGQAPSLFLNGACGDVNPTIAHETNPSFAREMGETLAASALACRLEYIAEISELVMREEAVEVPVHVPQSSEEIRQRIRDLNIAFGVPTQAFDERVASMEAQLATGSFPTTTSIKLSLLAIGEYLAFLFVPGELFAETGLAMQALSPYRTTLIVTMANGSLGYLPSAESYASGGYEPYQACWFYDGHMFTPELEPLLIAAAGRLLNA